MSGLWLAAFVALWALVLLLALLLLGTLRRLVPLLERFEAGAAFAGSIPPGGLSARSAVPPFLAHDLRGTAFTERDLRGGMSIVLFLSNSCRACELLDRDLKHGRVPRLGARLIAVTSEPKHARELARSPRATVLLQEDGAVAEAFETRTTPHAFVVDEQATVLASGTPNDWSGLRQLLEAATKGGDGRSDTAAAVVRS